jgi:Flp pilus assembly protein CpaB
MKRRSTLLMGIGVAVFVLGAGLVLLSLKHGKATQSVATSPAAAPAPVVVATKAMPGGTTGEALIEAGAVTLQQAPTGSYRADDLTSLTALNQQALTGAVAAGQPIEASNLHTDAGDLTPPAGDESVAITIPSGAAGVAGYIAPGDDVDVYGLVSKVSVPGGSTTMSLPCTTRLYSKVQVLDVSTQVAPYRSDKSTAGRSTPGSITFFLAATPAQAQTLIFYTTNEGLYLTTAASAPPPADGTACPALTTSPELSPAP